MLIKSKILLNTFITLFLTVLLIVLFVVWQLNASVSRQTKELQDDLIDQVNTNATADLRFLQELFDGHDRRLTLNVNSITANTVVAEHVKRGQDVALRGKVMEIFAGMRSDFLVVFDKYEHVVAAAPDLDRLSVTAESLLNSPHMQELKKRIRSGNFAENSVEVGYWQWGLAGQDLESILKGEEERKGGILKLAVGAILNDYKDEVIGFVMAGKFMGQFQEAMDNSYEITGMPSIIYWGRFPLVWSGFDTDAATAVSGRDLLLDKDIDEAAVATSNYAHLLSMLAGNAYYVTFVPILDYSGKKIGTLLVGAPESKVMEASAILKKQGLATRNQVLFSLSIIGLLALGVSLFVQWFGAAALSRPIVRCMEFVKAVSGGNLEATLLVESKDEIGQLAQAMHLMIRNIKSVQKGIQNEVRRDLKETVEKLAAFAYTLDTMSEHIAEESGNMAVASKRVSETINTIAQSAGITQENMNSVTTATAQMSSTILEISKNTSKAHSISKAAVDSGEDSSTSMQTLNKASKDIGSVVDLIDAIADHIELLALNAKIEAGRAGEAGRGFGVVADEIKELSKQANEATDQIRRKIIIMQGATSTSLGSITSVNKVIRDVNDIVSNIASAVEEQAVSADYIVGNIGTAREEMQGVAQSVSEAADVVDKMAYGLGNVNNDIDEMQRTASQLHEATTQLNSIGQKLLKMVEKFG